MQVFDNEMVKKISVQYVDPYFLFEIEASLGKCFEKSEQRM